MKAILPALFLLVCFPCAAQDADTSLPLVSLNNIEYGLIDGKKVLPTLSIPEILVNQPRLLGNSGYNLLSFEVMVYTESNEELTGPVKSDGKKYSEEIVDLLSKHANQKGTVYIDEIKAIGPDQVVRKLHGIEINFR